MRYEIATLTIRLGGIPAALEGIKAYTADPAHKGTLLGVWNTEIGELNNLIVLRGFEDPRALMAERKRTLASANPFGAAEVLNGLGFEAYMPFPFLPPVPTGKFGDVYEIRTYKLKPGGMEPTIAAWEAAMVERGKLSPLVFAGVAVDGPPRFTHIWPFATLNDRARIRAESVKLGIWPPKGGPNWLTGDMRSTIALPAAISPLC